MKTSGTPPGGRKPKASDRTVDMFSGKTQAEQAEEAERIRLGTDIAEAREAAPVAIEDNVDRYRATAFAGQEWFTEQFGDKSATSDQYRVSLKNGVVYLEKTGAARGGNGAYSYAGLMLPEGDLPKLAKAIVGAAKAYLAKPNKGQR